MSNIVLTVTIASCGVVEAKVTPCGNVLFAVVAIGTRLKERELLFSVLYRPLVAKSVI